MEEDISRRRGRRSTDDIDPVIELFVKDQVREARHLLRGEFTAAFVGMTNKLTELGNNIATRDLRASQDTARLEKKLGELQVHDATSSAVADALEKQRTSLRTYMIGLGGLIVAASAVIVAVLVAVL